MARATVQPQTYSLGEGWGLGQAAPSDKYASIDPADGSLGEVTDEPTPGVPQRLVVAKGDTVTNVIRTHLGITED